MTDHARPGQDWSSALARTGAQGRRSLSRCLRRGRGAERGEGIGDDQGPGREPVERGRPAAQRRGPGGAGRRLDDAAAGQDALQVGRRDRVADRRGVDVPQLGDRERRGGQREADIGVGQLGPQPVAPRLGDRPVVERGRRKVLDTVPGGVRRDARLDVGGYQGQVGRGQDPAPRITRRVAAGLQLLQVRDVGEVDLGRQMPPQRTCRAARPLPAGRRAAPTVPRTAARPAARAARAGCRRGPGGPQPAPRDRTARPAGIPRPARLAGEAGLAARLGSSWHVRMVLARLGIGTPVLDYKAKTFYTPV